MLSHAVKRHGKSLFLNKKKKNRRFCSCFIHIGTKHVHNTQRHIQTHTKRKNEQFQSTQYLIVFRISFISIIDTKQTKQNGTKRANNKRWYAQLIFQFSLFLNFFFCVMLLFNTRCNAVHTHAKRVHTACVRWLLLSFAHYTHLCVSDEQFHFIFIHSMSTAHEF